MFAPRAFSADVLVDQSGTGIRPSQNATPGFVPGSRPQTPQVQRAIPGRDAPTVPRDVAIPVIDPSQVPPPQPNLPRESVAVPDRWRIMQSLGFKFPLFDPYNQNVIKGDLPVLQNTLGPDWFFNLGIIADTLYEQRNFPVPVPPATSTTGGQANIFGNGEQSIFAHNLIVSLSLTKGNTTFKPPDYEFRLTPVFNYTDVRVNEDRLLKISSSSGDVRREVCGHSGGVCRCAPSQRVGSIRFRQLARGHSTFHQRFSGLPVSRPAHGHSLVWQPQ